MFISEVSLGCVRQKSQNSPTLFTLFNTILLGENSHLALFWHFLKTKEKSFHMCSLQGSLQASPMSYPLKETLFHTMNQSICEGRVQAWHRETHRTGICSRP